MFVSFVNRPEIDKAPPKVVRKEVKRQNQYILDAERNSIQVELGIIMVFRICAVLTYVLRRCAKPNPFSSRTQPISQNPTQHNFHQKRYCIPLLKVNGLFGVKRFFRVIEQFEEGDGRSSDPEKVYYSKIWKCLGTFMRFVSVFTTIGGKRLHGY